MRPANLIPPEERRSRGGGLRAAPLAYLIVGALLLAIGGMALLVTTDNKIADRKAEIAETRHATRVAESKANRLATFTEFQTTAEARAQTVINLANSRFDWEKVMRQMALISPVGVWLTSLQGSVSSGASIGGGESVALRSEVSGPALSITGCAVSAGAVANYITELKEIEGVTRVGLQTASRGGAAGAGAGDCPGRGTATFQAVAAFDAAPIPTEVIGGEIEEPVEEATTEEGSESTGTSEGE